jgi:hypothetical protein
LNINSDIYLCKRARQTNTHEVRKDIIIHVPKEAKAHLLTIPF